MNIYLNELKRLLNKRSTKQILIAGVLMTILICAISYFGVQCDEVRELGERVTSYGKEAVKDFDREREIIEGEMSEEKLEEAVKEVQKLISGYDVRSRSDLPEEALDELSPYDPISRIIVYPYNVLEEGKAYEIGQIDTKEPLNFYESCSKALEKELEGKYKDQATRKLALKKYDKVKKPYQYKGFFSEDTPIFLTILITMISLLCVLMASQLYSEDRENELDQMIRSSKEGHGRYVLFKALSIVTLASIFFILCMTAYYLLLSYIYGDNLETSYQMQLFKQTAICNMSIGKYMRMSIFSSFLFMLASLMASLVIGIKSKTAMISAAISILIFFLPSLLYGKLRSKLILLIFPASGLGSGDNGIVTQFGELEFVRIFGRPFWLPDFLIFFSIFNIFLYFFISFSLYEREGE